MHVQHAVIKRDKKNVTIPVFIAQNGTGADEINGAAGKTGLTASDLNSAGYYREGATAGVALTLTDTATKGTYEANTIEEIDATNAPGWYYIDLPDAVCAHGADWVVVSLGFDQATDEAQDASVYIDLFRSIAR